MARAIQAQQGNTDMQMIEESHQVPIKKLVTDLNPGETFLASDEKHIWVKTVKGATCLGDGSVMSNLHWKGLERTIVSCKLIYSKY